MSLELISSDIWIEIIDLLDNKSKIFLLRTSKFFWNIEFRKYYINIDKFHKADFTSIRYLKATSLSFESLDNSLTKIPFLPLNLREFWLSNKNFSNQISFDNIYQYLITPMKNLTFLYLDQIDYIKEFPENITDLDLNCCRGNFSNLPKNLKTFIYSFSENQLIDYNHLILPDGLENLNIYFGGNSIRQPKLPKLPSNLKYLVYDNLVADSLPDNLEKLDITNKNLLFSDKISFKNIKKLSFNIQGTIHNINYFEDKLSTFEKLEELEINLVFINGLKLPDTLRKLKLIITNSEDKLELDLSSLTYLSIKNIENLSNTIFIEDAYKNIYFIEKIKALNLIELNLSGRFNFDTDNLIVPNLKILTLSDNFKGRIYRPISVVIFKGPQYQSIELNPSQIMNYDSNFKFDFDYERNLELLYIN